MTNRKLYPLPVSTLAAFLTLVVGCDEEGAGSGSIESALTIEGDVGAYYDGPGTALHVGGFDGTYGTGMLNADGTFTLELGGLDAVESSLKVIGDSHLDNFRSFLCLHDLVDEIDDDARFLLFRSFNIDAERDDGSFYFRTVELSSRTEGEARSIGLPFPTVYGGDYVFWLFADRAHSLHATCDGAEIALDLAPGWNEFNLDMTRYAQRQYMGPRPSGVAWYMEPTED
jgi:hypothetical protein